MSNPMTETQTTRPLRADARRNYEKLVDAARQAFAEQGTSASLEAVAEAAGVGIGTLYRHFPNRQALLEAVYADEVETMARGTYDLADRDPWDAVDEWLHRYIGFAATKHALMEAMLEAAPDSDVLVSCRTMLRDAGTELIDRAKAAGAIRPDAEFMDIARMVGQIALTPNTDAETKERMLRIVLDGLRAPR